MELETPYRIEPARLEEMPSGLADIVADVASLASKLGTSLHPKTAASLAGMVRIMNTYYSNLIEGHATRPRDIEAALLSGTAWARIDELPPQTSAIESALQDRDAVPVGRRDLLIEAVSHVRLQEKIDETFAAGKLPEPASTAFLSCLHREFYDGASDAMLTIKSGHQLLRMRPGEWRKSAEEDVVVGRHVPPSSERVTDFMAYFEKRFELRGLGRAARILALPAAHHRFNYIHPFLDGNGRVSRLMSHAMAHVADIGAGGLWSVSRGLARGLASRSEYKFQLDRTDMPRQGSRDGRGNLSEKALIDFSIWFLEICRDQISFMSELFQFNTLQERLNSFVVQSPKLKPETSVLLEMTLLRGELARGEVARIVSMPERSARRLLSDSLEAGILVSDTPKGPVRLNFPSQTHEVLFPRLFN